MHNSDTKMIPINGKYTKIMHQDLRIKNDATRHWHCVRQIVRQTVSGLVRFKPCLGMRLGLLAPVALAHPMAANIGSHLSYTWQSINLTHAMFLSYTNYN